MEVLEEGFEGGIFGVLGGGVAFEVEDSGFEVLEVLFCFLRRGGREVASNRQERKKTEAESLAERGREARERRREKRTFSFLSLKFLCA